MIPGLGVQQQRLQLASFRDNQHAFFSPMLPSTYDSPLQSQ